MQTGLEITYADSVIGAEIDHLDLSQPLSDERFAAIEAAFNERAVLCLRGQTLTAPQFIDFARRFGEVEKIFLSHYAHPQHPEILLVSNIQENGRDIGHADAGRVWHSDMSYTALPPASDTIIRRRSPHGKRRGRWAAPSSPAPRPPTIACPRRCKPASTALRAVHQVAGRRQQTGTGKQDDHLRRQQPSVTHPVARTHPVTGRRCLYVSKGECQAIEGMENGEALALIDELAERTVAPPFRYTHQWRVGDILMWDNCSVQHLATFDYEWPRHRRLMHRITVGRLRAFLTAQTLPLAF